MMRLGVLMTAGTLAIAPAQAPSLSIVLLIDVTASVSEAMATFVWDGRGSLEDMNPTGTKPPDSPRDLFLQPILRGFIPNLSPPDRVRIGTIARTLRFSPEFSADRAVLGQVARELLDVPRDERFGPTPLWDAVDAAITALESEPGHRAIVLLTDGLSTGNHHSLSTVIDRAVDANVSVSIIAEAWRIRSGRGFALRDSTNAPWKRMTRPQGGTLDAHVKRLADETGGVFLTDGASGWPAPGPLLARVLGELRLGPQPAESSTENPRP